MKLTKKEKEDIKGGLILSLIYGLIVGLTITFTTQLIALITSNPEFVMFDFIASFVLIIIIEIIGWIIVKEKIIGGLKLRKKLINLNGEVSAD